MSSEVNHVMQQIQEMLQNENKRLPFQRNAEIECTNGDEETCIVKFQDIRRKGGCRRVGIILRPKLGLIVQEQEDGTLKLIKLKETQFTSSDLDVLKQALPSYSPVFARLGCSCIWDEEEPDESFDQEGEKNTNRDYYEVVIKFDNKEEFEVVEGDMFDNACDHFNHGLPAGFFAEELCDFVRLEKPNYKGRYVYFNRGLAPILVEHGRK